MLSGMHLVWLAICLAIIGGLTFFSLKYHWKFQTAAFVATGFAICSELVKMFTRLKEYDSIIVAADGTMGAGGYIEVDALPLHLCSLLLFVIFLLTLSKNEGLKEVLKSFFVPAAFVGGICAIMLPQDGLSFANVKVWQGFVYHAGILWFAIYMLATKQVSLGVKAYIRNSIMFLSLVVILIWLNGVLQVYAMSGVTNFSCEVNFLFLAHPPRVEGGGALPILNLNHGYAAYVARIMALGVFVVTCIHLGPMIKEIKRKAKAKQAE